MILIFSSYYDAIDFWTYRKKKDPYFIVMKDWKFGIVNKDDEMLIPLEYDFIGVFHSPYNGNGMVRVQKDDKWGYINSDLEIVVPIIYDCALPFQNKTTIEKGYKHVIKSTAKVSLNEESFIIDIGGNSQTL